MWIFYVITLTSILDHNFFVVRLGYENTIFMWFDSSLFLENLVYRVWNKYLTILETNK